LCAGHAATAQTLDAVDRHLQEGRLQAARRALLQWEAAESRPGRADRQRGLWLRGLLTLDPDEAASSYARLVVEYPGGPFTDRALLRMAMAADLRGETDEAREHYAQLARDYPTSPLHQEAASWLRNHPGTETTAEGEGAAPDGTEPPAATGGYTVQLGAFGERRWAEELAGRVQAAGFEPRIAIFPGDDLVRVRVGRFGTRAEALVLRDRLQAAGFDAGLATDAERERRSG
ncbi:MAG: SPOR domain-containing protein, partial [Gemmatimonadota bacterium]